MRLGLTAVLVLSLAAVAAAQPVKAPAKAAPAAAASPTSPVQIVPVQPKAGWVTVEVPGGFYRYQATAGSRAKGEGGLVIVPGTLRPRQPDELTSAGPATEPATASATMAPTSAPAPSCERERGQLNQRLWSLRGVDVDPASANVLSDAESPLQPSAWGFVAGYGPGTASDLPAAASSDSTTRDLLQAYAACVRSSGR